MPLLLSLVSGCPQVPDATNERPDAARLQTRAPAVTLARVPAATPSPRSPLAVVTVTLDQIQVHADATFEQLLGSYASDASGWTGSWMNTAGERGRDSALRRELEAVRERARLEPGDDALLSDPRLRLRVAADVTTDLLVYVLAAASFAGFGAVEFAVAAPGGEGHFALLPYTFCACPMPPGATWCAVPRLYVTTEGVTLVAAADLTPPPGCHKAIRGYRQEEPRFEATPDWRSRAIADEQGRCPTAPIGPAGLDSASLSHSLRALHQAAPGCAFASVSLGKVTWSVLAPTLATVFATYGEVRVSLRDIDDDDKITLKSACSRALDPSSLQPATPRGPPLTPRRGCAD